MTITATTSVPTASDDTTAGVPVELDRPGRRATVRAARQRFARRVAALPAGRSAVMPVLAAPGRGLGDR